MSWRDSAALAMESWGARRCGAVKRWVAELYPVVATPRGFLGQSRHARSQALGARRPAAESTVRPDQRYRELPAVPSLVHARKGAVPLGAGDRRHGRREARSVTR